MTQSTHNQQQRRQEEPEPYVSTQAVADFLGKPRSWIFDNAGRLGMPRFKIGNQYRYRLSEISEWVSSTR